MADGVPDTKIIKQSLSLQLRAKYQTKRQAPRPTLMCGQIVPHPSNRGCVSQLRAKVLLAGILEAGYDPVETAVDTVAVEIYSESSSGCPSSKFADHFKAIQGWTRLFAGLSHNHKHVAERNMANGMPGCACEEPAISRKDCC